MQSRERLGWLTESSVQPRKRKMIEGECTTSLWRCMLTAVFDQSAELCCVSTA